MHHAIWCEHLDKRSKISVVDYRCAERVTALKIQSWYCPECGVHGAETELIQPQDADSAQLCLQTDDQDSTS